MLSNSNAKQYQCYISKQGNLWVKDRRRRRRRVILAPRAVPPLVAGSQKYCPRQEVGIDLLSLLESILLSVSSLIQTKQKVSLEVY